MNALELAEDIKVHKIKIINSFKDKESLLGIIKTPETAHKVIVKLILTLNNSIIFFVIVSISILRFFVIYLFLFLDYYINKPISTMT